MKCSHFNEYFYKFQAAFYQDRLLQNGVSGGRSFFLPPERREYLGDFYELWLGLFQSVVLGNVPLLNVDVNHKAFPKRYNSIVDDLFPDMERDMRLRIDPNRPLDRMVSSALERHLGGLEILYRGPGNSRIYKFMRLDNDPANVRFRGENGEEKTVLKYFQDTNRNIRYQKLPCIRLGNSINNIVVPMEFCGIPDTQVNNPHFICQTVTNFYIN